MNDEIIYCVVCGGEIKSGGYYNIKDIPCCCNKCRNIVTEQFTVYKSKSKSKNNK